MKKLYLLLLAAILLAGNVSAQYVTLELGTFKKAYRDSLKKIEYNHIFPILGKKAYKKGIDVPLPFGIMPAYFYQRQQYEISNIQIGIDGSDLVDISGIQFGVIEGQTHAFTVRPDIWIFPFWNVYGLVGYGTTATSVEVIKPSIQTIQHFNGVNFGLGTTLAGAIGPVFITADANFNWVQFEELTKPVPAINLSMRVGHTFTFDERPYRNVGVWVGPFYQNVQNDTEGEMSLSQIFGDKENEIRANIQDWYDGLSAAEQKAMEGVYDKIVNEIDKDHTVHYKLDKEVSQYWNMVVGIQYQHNKSWQFRTELGTFGKRTQFLLTVNYRFL